MPSKPETPTHLSIAELVALKDNQINLVVSTKETADDRKARIALAASDAAH